MKKIKPFLMGAAHILVILLILLLLWGSVGYNNAGPRPDGLKTIQFMTVSIDGGQERIAALPCTFTNLAPHTLVTLSADFTPMSDDTVYIKSDHSPAKIFLNGHLAYEFGKPENSPSFMQDPAPEVHMVETGGTGENMHLQMDFFSPTADDSLTIQAPILGSSKEVIKERSSALGMHFLLSIVQIVYGLSLILICLCILLVDKKGISFLWLGLLSLTTGIWAFGENDFTAIIFKNSTFLYLISYTGFYLFSIPMLRFARSVIDFENPKPLWYIELFTLICVAAAMILQLLGIVPFYVSTCLFHWILPSVLLILTACTVYEAILYHNITARRFIIPIGVLTGAAFLELIRIRRSVTYVFSSMFQLGTLFFLIVMGVTAGLAVKDSVTLKRRSEAINFEKNMMDIRLKEQESQSALLTQHQQTLSQQRHDLRHHLSVIQELAGKENVPLQEYLQGLMDQIPKGGKMLCENRAVNAIMSHYSGICRMHGISLKVSLAVPAECPQITDNELCVIFGNMLENAVEACDRMKDDKRFIKLSTNIHNGFLTIAMDNSFNGIVWQEGQQFRSSKRDEFGIGLASIRSVAQKHSGEAEFRHDRNVFYSSVYVKM